MCSRIECGEAALRYSWSACNVSNTYRIDICTFGGRTLCREGGFEKLVKLEKKQGKEKTKRKIYKENCRKRIIFGA